MKKFFIVLLIMVLLVPFFTVFSNAGIIMEMTQAEYDDWISTAYVRPGDGASGVSEFNSFTTNVQRCKLFFDDDPAPELFFYGFPYYFVERISLSGSPGLYRCLIFLSKYPFIVFLNDSARVVVVDNGDDLRPINGVVLSSGSYYCGEDGMYDAGGNFLYSPDDCVHPYLAISSVFYNYYSNSSYLSNCDIYELEMVSDGSGGYNYTFTDNLLDEGDHLVPPSSGSGLDLYSNILRIIGMPFTDKMKEYAYLTSCVLLVVGCWAIVKVASWLFKI